MSTYQIFRLPTNVLLVNGVFQPGWSVAFYLTGTSTPTPVYTTSALDPGAVHTQPVEADAAGVLPVIYLDPSISYKIRYYNEAGVEQPSEDPVNDQILSAASIGALLYPLTFVGDGSTYAGTGDIGAQINAAYAALPATGGKIIVNPKSGGGKYDFSTPIVLDTIGKYPVIEGIAPGGARGSEGCPLNYTPTTATAAITFDYASVVVGPPAPNTPLRYITLTNNDINTSGGGGSSATCIKIGSTNGGDWDATYESCMFQGFGLWYDNPNNTAVTQQFNNCVITCNDVAISAAITTMRFMGGQFAANGKVVNQKAGVSQPELYFIGTTIFDNFHDPVFDCNNSTTPMQLDFTACHLENSPVLHSHYITGAANVAMRGGIMEDDNPTGSSDYMIKTDNYTTVTIDDTLIVANRALATVVDTTNLVRARVNAVIRGSNVAALAAGANSAESITMAVNQAGNTYYPFNFPAASAFRSALTLADPNFQSGATYTIAATDYYVSFSAACTVTLPDPATNVSRVLVLRTTAAAAVISASSNVIAQAGGGGGTAILAATAGKFAEMQSNGTNWVIWQSN